MAAREQRTAESPSSWQIGDRQYESLLIALARRRAEVAATEEELDATARRGMADLLEYQRREQAEDVSEARAELGRFRTALADARARNVSSGRAEVPYDSQNAQQNEMSDLLIQYLVRTGYAEVRTEEPREGHYVYWINIDWPRLRELVEGDGSRTAA